MTEALDLFQVLPATALPSTFVTGGADVAQAIRSMYFSGALPEHASGEPGSGVRPVAFASRHRSSHQEMWTDVRVPDGLTSAMVKDERLDLIVMPTARSFANDLPGLALALELASKFSALLVVYCSKDAKVEEFPWQHAKAMGLDATHGLRPLVIDFDEIGGSSLPQSRSARTPIARFRRPIDTGPKRNLGLALARQMGADNVLFLDDDIKPANYGPTLTTLSLAHAIQKLRTDTDLQAIGFTASDQPDNSVVCHVRRQLGYEQRIFLGAGALLVKMSERTPHFPVSMYNEDWLFMMYLCAAAPNYKLALGWAGDVHQSASPIYSSERAWSEEPGDLIGEGLMNLLHDHGPAFLDLATEKFWQDAIKARLEMLKMLRSKWRATSSQAVVDCDQEPEIDVLRTATSAYSLITPKDIRDYLSLVTDDQAEWSRLLRPVSDTVPTLVQGRSVAALSSYPLLPLATCVASVRMASD